MKIELNESIVLDAIKHVEQTLNKVNSSKHTSARFILAVAMSASYGSILQTVIEDLSKQRFCSDVKLGVIGVNVEEGKTQVSWEDYANNIVETVLPDTFAARPRWFSH